MDTITCRTLVSLAILKINWESAKTDYIDNFIPLLGSLLLKKGYTQFESESLGNLKNDFKDEYGLIIPNYALLSICNRAAKRNCSLLKRDSGIFFVNDNVICNYDNSKKRHELEEKFDLIVNRIIQYASRSFGIQPSKDEISEAIVAFLKHHDLDILFAAKDLSVLPRSNSTAKMKYVICSFAIHAKENGPELFKALVDLAIGNALACSILYSNTSYSGKLKDLNLYIDTPLILTLVGLSGSFKKVAFEELLDMLKEEKANLRILETTRGEVDHILNQCHKILEKGEENIDLDKASISVRHCVNNNISATDLEMKIVHLDSLLISHGIVKSKVPDYMDSRQFQIKEEELKQTIVDTYKTHRPDFVLTQSLERTIDRDVKVLSGIYRFRQGIRPRTIRQSKDLFITSNTSLAYASRLYELKRDNDSAIIPSCLTDVFVGTVLWLQSPQKVAELSEKKFIADCYAANQPTETLLTAYVKEINKLKNDNQISLDEYYLLRSHRVALNLLEERTMGDPAEITGETISQIIAQIKADIRGKADQDLKDEQFAHDWTKKQLKDTKEELRNRDIVIENRAERIATFVGNIIWILILVGLSWALYVTNFSNNTAPSLFLILLLALYLLTVLNLMKGFNFWDFRKMIIAKIKSCIWEFFN